VPSPSPPITAKAIGENFLVYMEGTLYIHTLIMPPLQKLEALEEASNNTNHFILGLLN
jgi:hypothetical protein